MAKYECSYCGDNLKPCVVGHDDRRPVKLLGICPFRRHAQPRWKQVSDKPDPHVVTEEPQADGSSTTLTVEDDEIVKLADKLLYEHSLEGSRKALRPVFRLIAAEIEGVQEHLDEHNSDFVSNNMDHEDLERKVEELERKHGWCDTLHTHPVKPKPQSKGGVARDKDGKKLIPGVSVLGHVDEGLIGPHHLFHHRDKEHIYHYPICGTAHIDKDLCSALANELVKLFDLPFPGGDK